MWATVVNTVLGIWLMAAPALLGYGAPAATNDRIIGPVVATFAAVAAWEVTRPVRWVNLPLGLWLMLAPLILGYAELPATINSIATGLAIALLSAVRGSYSAEFGGGWSALWRVDQLVQERQEQAQQQEREQREQREVEVGGRSA